MGPADLEDIIKTINKPLSEQVLVGPGDDAGVYLLPGGPALVETVDIITPLVNDPFNFGAISAANSLSDIYAMGGKPLTALAILGFSPCAYEPEIIREILRGAVSIIDTAGVKLMGGHSLEDDELKFGLCVTGTVNKDRILRVSGARPGDILIVTKPIGTGIMTTALKAGKLTDEDLEPVVKWLLTLNDRASAAALNAEATAATDVTGFGLLGHAHNMVKDSATDFIINSAAVPVFERAREFIASGIVPQGAYNNLNFLEGKVDFPASLDEEERLLLSDPQTSGGLLIAIPERNVGVFKASGTEYSIIGRVEKGSGRLKVTQSQGNNLSNG